MVPPVLNMVCVLTGGTFFLEAYVSPWFQHKTDWGIFSSVVLLRHIMRVCGDEQVCLTQVLLIQCGYSLWSWDDLPPFFLASVCSQFMEVTSLFTEKTYSDTRKSIWLSGWSLTKRSTCLPPLFFLGLMVFLKWELFYGLATTEVSDVANKGKEDRVWYFITEILWSGPLNFCIFELSNYSFLVDFRHPLEVTVHTAEETISLI